MDGQKVSSNDAANANAEISSQTAEACDVTRDRISLLGRRGEGGGGGGLSKGAEGLGFLKEDDAVCVCSLAHVAYTPAIGSFGELLLVHKDQNGFQTRRFGRRNNEILEFQLPVADLPDFEGHESFALQDAVQLGKTIVIRWDHSSTRLNIHSLIDFGST